MYDRMGGKGIALTKKTNDQKDLGEPAFLPMGNMYTIVKMLLREIISNITKIQTSRFTSLNVWNLLQARFKE